MYLRSEKPAIRIRIRSHSLRRDSASQPLCCQNLISEPVLCHAVLLNCVNPCECVSFVPPVSPGRVYSTRTTTTTTKLPAVRVQQLRSQVETSLSPSRSFSERREVSGSIWLLRRIKVDRFANSGLCDPSKPHQQGPAAPRIDLNSTRAARSVLGRVYSPAS